MLMNSEIGWNVDWMRLKNNLTPVILKGERPG